MSGEKEQEVCKSIDGNEQDNKKEKKDPPKRKKDKDLEYLSLSASDLINLPENHEFKDLLIRRHREIKEEESSFLNFDSAMDEIDKYYNISTRINMSEDSDIELYTEVIDQIQSSRDRMCTIFHRAQSDLSTINTYYEHLFKIWVGKFSKLSSDKKREGEAEFILSFLIRERTRRERIFNKAKAVYLNLGNKMESVSRKITVLQQVHKVIGISSSSDPEISNIKKNLSNHREKMNKEKKTGKIGWSEI